MPRPLSRPVFTHDQVRRLQALRSRPPGNFGPRKLGRLRSLLGLARMPGRSYAGIATEANITPQALWNIRQDAKKRGVEALIRDLEKVVTSRVTGSKTIPSTRRGRPNTPTLAALCVNSHPEREAVVEFVYLQLSAHLYVAVLGIRFPSRRRSRQDASPSEEEINILPSLTAKHLRKTVQAAIAARTTRPSWTPFPPDLHLKIVSDELRRLHQKTILSREIITPSLPETSWRKKLQNPSRWEFHVLSAGDPVVVDSFVTQLMEGCKPPRHHWGLDDFLPRLEQLAHELRITCNINGSFPCSFEKILGLWGEDMPRIPPSGLTQRNPVSASSSKSSSPLGWQLTGVGINAAIRHRIGVAGVLAHTGYALTLPFALWNKIGHREVVAMQIRGVKPNLQLRAAASGDDEGMATLSFGALPDLAYELPFRLKEGLRQDEKTLRDSVWSRPQAFEYRVRLAEGQPTSSYPVHLQDGMPSENPGVPPPKVAVVSLQRQFLFAAPLLDFSALAALASESTEPVEKRELAIEGDRQPVFIFRCPNLLSAIDEAFQANRYGDALNALRTWKSQWSDGIDQRRQAVGDHEEDPDQEWLLWDVAMQLPDMVPPFHFSGSDLAASPSSALVQARLAATQVAEIELLCDSAIREGARGRVLHPGYDSQVTLRQLYFQLDADFLLRHISSDAWQRLDQFKDRLNQKGREVITEYFQPSTVDGWDKVRRTVKLSQRETLDRNRDEASLWVDQALASFCAFPRVLRHAVEIAQRFALAGLPHQAIVVYREKELISQFASYLGQIIAPKAAEIWRTQDKTRGFDDNDAALYADIITEDGRED